MDYTYGNLKKLIRNYKIYGTLFSLFFILCITSVMWMPIFYQPLENINIGVTIALHDATIVVDRENNGRISNKEFFQIINIVARKQIAETTAVILIIQDEKILSTYILADSSKTSIKLTFRPISKSPIYFNYYQPPPLVAEKITQTGNYDLLTDYYVKQSIRDYREF